MLEIWDPHVGPTSCRLICATVVPAWVASVERRVCSSFPVTSLVCTAPIETPALWASAERTSASFSIERLCSAILLVGMPSCLASAASTPSRPCTVGVGDGAGVGVGVGAADALAFADGVAEELEPIAAEGEALALGPDDAAADGEGEATGGFGCSGRLVNCTTTWLP